MGLEKLTAQPIAMATATHRDPDDSLESLVRDYHAPVTRLAYRLLGWRESQDLEDLVHDVFLVAFKQQHRFRGDASTWTWLAAITINRCRSIRRRKLLYFRWLKVRSPVREAAGGEEIQQDEIAQHVRDAVAKLNPRDRELIVLHYLEELTFEQISAITGTSTKTLHVRMHRARERLKKLLTDD
jgi:RNA polymerase sigma-70 factor (ECF subfamily)